MDMEEVSKKIERLEERMDGMETRVKSLDDTVQRAVAAMMPKMDALLRAQTAGANDGFPENAGGTETTDSVSSASLLEAAERDDVKELVRVLDAGADIQQRDARGNTALHLAAIHGHPHAASVLVGCRAPLNLPGPRVRTPLHCAAAHGHLQVAQRLLDAGAKVDALDYWGDTALFSAATQGHEDVVGLLLEKTSVDVCGKGGDPLLVYAAKTKRWGVVKLLLQKGASATKCKEAMESALVLAAKGGRADVVSDLLWRGSASDKKQVEEALKDTKTAAVVWAFAEALPSAGNVFGGHGLRAAKEGRSQLLAVLLETEMTGPNWHYIDDKRYLLHLAAANGHLECVEKLLQHGAKVDAADSVGDSPLHLASRAGHAHCARALLAAGASTTIQNSDGKTPLDEAKNDDVRGVFQAS